jgi:hypothetical protein
MPSRSRVQATQAVAVLLLILAAGGVRAAERPPEPLPAYRLRIEPEPLRALQDYRDRIYDFDFLPPGERLWIPATFEHSGERYPVRLRIRGDLPVHWRGEQLSYRLKFMDRLFEGRKEINLIVPWDKHYGVELLQTRVADDLGLAYFPGRFVSLAINDRDIGLYYENEHPTREYLERTGREPSSIFTFAANWTYYFGQRYHTVWFEKPGTRERPPISSLGQIKQRRTFTRRDPELARRQLGYAAELYDLLSRGSLEEIAARAGLYLDLEGFARYVALQDFFGSVHSLELGDNTRLYLDPSSGKFEFMPWDTRLMSLRERWEEKGGTLEALLEPDDAMFRAMFEAIPGVRAARDAALGELVREGSVYNAELDRIHARLVRLHPEDERLRAGTVKLDGMFRENLEVLAPYAARRAEIAPQR